MTEKQFREKERDAAVKKHSKQKKRKKKAGAVAMLVLLGAVLIVTAVILLSVTVFKIENIKVLGNQVYTASQIIEETELELGDSLILFDRNSINEEVCKNLPFINEVSFKRELPNTLVISVSEVGEENCYYQNGAFFSASANGKILKSYDARPDDLTAVIADENEVIECGEYYSCPDTVKAAMQKTVLKFASDNNINITLINATDIYRVYFIIEDKILVELGSSTYLERKLEFLPQTLEKMKGDSRNVVDLSNWSPDNNEAISYGKDINSYFVFK